MKDLSASVQSDSELARTGAGGRGRSRSQRLSGPAVGAETEGPRQVVLPSRACVAVGAAAARGVHLPQVRTSISTTSRRTHSRRVLQPTFVRPPPESSRTSAPTWPKFWAPVDTSTQWSTCQQDTPGIRTSSPWRTWRCLGSRAGGAPGTWSTASRSVSWTWCGTSSTTSATDCICVTSNLRTSLSGGT